MANNDDQLHWLVREATIRKLWMGFSVVLALIVLAQTVIHIKGYFGIDAWFGFGAVYGFGCCLLMVLVAKLLGLIMKRPQGYYSVSATSVDDAGQDSQDQTKERVKGNSDGA